jgi:hypothetical protein
MRATLSFAALLLASLGSPLLANTPARPDEPGGSPETGIVLSGQLRERATYQSALEYDAEEEAAGWFWTQRMQVALDAKLSPVLRARASLLSALIQGGEEQSPIERNELDVQEAFVEIGPEEAFVRLGRQEIRLGSQRLLAVRDGTTVRRNWDGARAKAVLGPVELDTFALRLVTVEPFGAFNDGRNEGRDIAGLQATFPAPVGKLDAYYIFSETDQRSTIEGIADERRHSLGLRAFGSSGGWFWDWEAVYQTGRFGNGRISAWTLATNTGFRWEDKPWKPEIMMSANIASGDDNVGDGRLGTFSALYPNASYFSENAVLGPANFFNLHPYFRVRPRENLFLALDLNFYWRLEREDGVYAPPGNLFRRPQGSRERFVDTSLSGVIEWEVNEQILVSLVFTHSAPQAFIRETGHADNIDFVEATLQFDF